MSHKRYLDGREYLKQAERRPRGQLGKGIAGILLGVLFFAGIFYSQDVVKWLGAPFLILPEAIGYIEQPNRADIINLEVEADDLEIVELEAGTYFLYESMYYDLYNGPSVTIGNQAGEPLRLRGATGGGRMYYSIWAWGAPALRFTVEEAGVYQLVFRDENNGGLNTFHVGIVPDILTGNETKFVRAIRYQLLFLVGIAFALLFWRYGLDIVLDFFRKPVVDQRRQDAMENVLREAREKKRVE
jgi:hypothetical protein